MEKLLFEFTVKCFDDPKTNTLALISIATKDGRVYGMPERYQPMGCHKKLMETETFKKVKNTLQKRHEKRRVWITLTKELNATYLDEDENVQFDSYFLEEMTSTAETVKNEGFSEESLSRVLEKFTKTESQLPKQINLKKVSEQFVIEKFTGENSNVTQWMEIFEKECSRFEIQKDENKIEILRLFLEKSCTHWYSSRLMEFTLYSRWEQWKNDFCDTFENKGWTPVRYAIEYKYRTGSLLDYAIRKEKLLLEVDKTMSKNTWVDLIAVGLPTFITNRIDRKKLKETKDLFNEIKGLEYLINKKTFDKNKMTSFATRNKEVKEPCEICKGLNKGNRYHPEAACWFRTREYGKGKEKQNVIKFVNNSELETELNNTGQEKN